MCVCVCVCARACVCVCVCARETDRQTDRQTDGQTDRDREREFMRACVSVGNVGLTCLASCGFAVIVDVVFCLRCLNVEVVYI